MSIYQKVTPKEHKASFRAGEDPQIPLGIGEL